MDRELDFEPNFDENLAWLISKQDIMHQQRLRIKSINRHKGTVTIGSFSQEQIDEIAKCGERITDDNTIIEHN